MVCSTSLQKICFMINLLANHAAAYLDRMASAEDRKKIIKELYKASSETLMMLNCAAACLKELNNSKK